MPTSSAAPLTIGKTNSLRVGDPLPFGLLLHSADDQQVVLPGEHNLPPGEWVEAFVYPDAEQGLVASLQIPNAELGDCAWLKVAQVNAAGAWLDWGTEQQLLVPLREQAQSMQVGLHYLVYVYLDEQRQQLQASSRLHRWLSEDGRSFTENQRVSLHIYQESELGYKAVVNGSHLGLLYHDQNFTQIKLGDQLNGFVSRVRPDGKLDLSLQAKGSQARSELAEQIIDDLRAHGGLSSLTDKSPAAEIFQRFAVSKGAYKKALGALYKAKRIELSKDSIRLTSTPD